VGEMKSGEKKNSFNFSGYSMRSKVSSLRHNIRIGTFSGFCPFRVLISVLNLSPFSIAPCMNAWFGLMGRSYI
jgi:hypothetical protein